MSGDAAELSGKVGEFVHDMLPSAHRVIALVNSPNPVSRPFLEQVWLAGVATGATVDPLMLRNIGELEAAFATIDKQRPDAVTLRPWASGASPNWR
jgi:putative tryptophan/tyrosine transport system substrate-binding protein